MYNRYIPQPDGSFRRSRMPDRHPPVPHRASPKREEPAHQDQPLIPQPHQDCDLQPEPKPRKHQGSNPGGSVSHFLKQLLPKDFDIGDLMIVLLLLLMAGDCQEDQNTALLTLALYFFM